VTSLNRRVAPPPRGARLRGTPAQDIAGAGRVSDCIEEWSLVGREACRRRNSRNVRRHKPNGYPSIMMCRFVLISGVPRAGKSSFADVIEGTATREAQLAAFSAAVKEWVSMSGGE